MQADQVGKWAPGAACECSVLLFSHWVLSGGRWAGVDADGSISLGH